MTTTKKFTTNPVAKDIKRQNEKRALKVKEKDLMESAENLYNKMGTEESVEIARKGHFYWDVVGENPTFKGELTAPFQWKIEHTKVAIIFFALGILFAHVVLVMPLLS